MYSWGQCENGQLGLGGIPDVEVSCPKIVSDLSITDSGAFIKAIEAGNSHSMILSSEGKVYTCGSNEYGQVNLNFLLDFFLLNSLKIYILKSSLDTNN